MRRTASSLALAVAVAALACGGEQSTPPSSATPASDPQAAAEPSPAEPAAARPRRREKPLPAFSGWTLEGEKLSISSLIGRRLLIFFFNPEVRDAATVAEAVGNISALRTKHNFEIVGVAVGSSPEKVRSFAKTAGIAYPVLDDSNGAIVRRLGLQSPLLILGVDAEGYVVFGVSHFPTEEQEPVRLIEDQIRGALRLPRVALTAEPVLGTRPPAPPFEAEILDSDERFSLEQHRGEPVLLVFFLHTCPHCHQALASIRETLESMPEDKRPLLVGIEVSGRTDSVRQRLRQEGLDFFPVLFDRDGSIRTAYGALMGVPDSILIDAEGRIAARVHGWREREDPPLMRMRLAQLAGAPVPMLLDARGYSGNEVCGVCHEAERETWKFTSHATAFDTLVKHGAETDPECVGCHVVGYQQPGGFTSASQTPYLEDVGCESCHGRGGPHLSPGFVKDGSYAETCQTCHDPKHSLGFEYASFLPRVSHAANAQLLSLPLEEKRARLAALGAPREDLLPAQADYVGSDACRSCHEAEYETWSKSPHAHAVKTLAEDGNDGKAECLACHTTAYGKRGGFAADASPAAHPDLARVGCESCHGPGGDHVGQHAVKIGSIVSLGDKCDSCVILQICGSCHDDANDPGFEFEVQEKIDAQRHGTIEAGTGHPLGTSAHWRAPGAVPRELAAAVTEAFALASPGG